MRARLIGSALAVGILAIFAPAVVAPVTAETSTTTTTIDPLASTTSTSTSTTTSTTTTTLPSAVTTVPEGCPLPPTAQAVFTGKVQSIDPVAATFLVQQVRAGSLEGYAAADTVEVRYGGDVKFLEVGGEYIVGVALDPVTQKLSSTIRDSAELFGGNEVAGGGVECPSHEAAARTLHMDGTGIESGVLSNFFGDPLRLIAALVLPAAMVFVLLVALVWVRRGTRR
ncbi:MAG: hypothetical protein RL573_953 [Actinomycetota bacterium]